LTPFRYGDLISNGMSSLIGRRIGNFELKSLLGEGGMGAVFVAEHTMIGRRVAIKLLRQELCGDQKLLVRFFNEARAANTIAHPNIVEVLDVGVMEDGPPYIVMELLEGENLAARIAHSGRIELGEALEYVRQAAAALTVAHDLGIVHRDLKPDNIFLESSGAQRRRVKLLDFGIAKLTAALTSASVQTRAGAILGTPAYMSPEQCLGRSGEVDRRTDVYALGVILFEMLCGAPPFVGEGFGEVLMQHMSRPPPAPRSINPDIPPMVELIILKALEKRREDRFATMAELEAALSDSRSDREGSISTRAAGVRRSLGAADRAGSPTPLPGSTLLLPDQRAARESGGSTAGGRSRPGQSTTLSALSGPRLSQTPRPRRRGLAIGAAGLAVAVISLALILGLGNPFRRPESGGPGASTAPESGGQARPVSTNAPPASPSVAVEPERSAAAVPPAIEAGSKAGSRSETAVSAPREPIPDQARKTEQQLEAPQSALKATRKGIMRPGVNRPAVRLADAPVAPPPPAVKPPKKGPLVF
jgi:serine/threonine protein kinase